MGRLAFHPFPPVTHVSVVLNFMVQGFPISLLSARASGQRGALGTVTRGTAAGTASPFWDYILRCWQEARPQHTPQHFITQRRGKTKSKTEILLTSATEPVGPAPF